MSPRSRGRPPGRGKPRQPGRRPPRNIGGPAGPALPYPDDFVLPADETTACWFDEPNPADRRSWAVPPMHGTYQGIDLELLDHDNEDDRTMLIEALHSELEDALDSDDELTAEDGEPFSPRLHITMHQVVANQLMADDPPETWQTVQRLIGLGYDWHNIMHMILGPVSEDIHHALTQRQPDDPRSYAQRLNDLPGEWPSPEELGLRYQHRNTRKQPRTGLR